jgi:DNA-binding transcriptional MocR family regulator
MTKKEIIWREILFQAIENKKSEFTQKELAQKYRFSLSTVFNALKVPREGGALEGKRGFRVLDIEKFLYLWATFRKIKKDIIYQTAVKKGVFSIEGEMPPSVIFGAYSAFLKKINPPPQIMTKCMFILKKRI